MARTPTSTPTATPATGPISIPGPLLASGPILLAVLLVIAVDRLVLRRRRQAHQATPVPAAAGQAQERPGVQVESTSAIQPTETPDVQAETVAGDQVEEQPGVQAGAATTVRGDERPGSQFEALVAVQAGETPGVQADAAPPDLTGRVLGPYQVQEKIGVGGMAVVYRGVHTTLDRPVAVKVLGRPLNEADLPDLARRFQREARTVAALRHPHIVQVFDHGAVDGTHYLVMEYVEGTDLRAAMKLHTLARRPWTPGEVLRILGQVGGALDYAHGRGVVHRDVKPANVLISTRGEHILTDFGLSAIRKTRTTLISTLGQPFGTPEYVAPEQATDYKKAGPPSDLYSLGCVAYELITGHLPFEAETPLAIALMHVSSDPMPPSFHVPDLPPAVDAVLLRVLEKEPARRYQTAQAFVQALRHAWVRDKLSSSGAEAKEPPGVQVEPVIAGQAETGPSAQGDVTLPGSRLRREDQNDESPGIQVEVVTDPAPIEAGSEGAAETAAVQADGAGDAPIRPDEVDLTPTQARMVLWAIEQNDARLSRGNVQERLGLSERRARTLMEDWTGRGWLTKSTNTRQPASVSAELATLARIRLGKGME